jgi:hypothetical protein
VGEGRGASTDCIGAGWRRAVQLMVIRNGAISPLVLCLVSSSLVSCVLKADAVFQTVKPESLARVGWRWGCSETFQHAVGGSYQGWVVHGCCVPDNGILGAEISVGEDITKSCYGAPRYFWMRCQKLLRQIFNGLSNDFQISGYGIDGATVFGKGYIIKS